MSVAECLGLADPESAMLMAARAAWPRWCSADRDLAVVPDLIELPRWTSAASRSAANQVLGALASLTATQPAAVTALAWVLLPGAEKVARKLADLHSDMDGLVAGQLWIEASQAHRLRTEKTAATILALVRREVSADVGVGDLAERRDRTMTRATESTDALEQLPMIEPLVDAGPVVVELFRSAYRAYAISGFDYWLLWILAEEADRQDAAAHRGRMGLTSPSVVEVVARDAALSARSLRTHAAKAIDRLRAFAEAREDPARFAEWTAQHPQPVLSVREERELAIREWEFDEFVKARRTAPLEVLLGDWARATVQRRA
ncbi:hypothetical protein GCM10028801_08930 [Nocardioides maradonensis]